MVSRLPGGAIGERDERREKRAAVVSWMALDRIRQGLLRLGLLGWSCWAGKWGPRGIRSRKEIKRMHILGLIVPPRLITSSTISLYTLQYFP